MNWKYCEERTKVYWKASGLINGHRVELIAEDDWDYGPQWKVESSQYGTCFSSPTKPPIHLTQAKEEAEAVFYKLEKTYKGKEYYE